jgi:peptidyl-prolyl cis-trans isomerase C
MDTTTLRARVNGVPLHDDGEQLPQAELRRRACTELLRQAAVQAGVTADSTGDAIERLLEHELQVLVPPEDACRRYHHAHRALYAQGERALLRHVLFAVTPGVDVAALRRRAEALLVELRCAPPDSDAFADAARRWSNCPSGAQGGELGWLGRNDCADEFPREVFGHDGTGVLPRLVHSRFGLHVVEVRSREPGAEPPFEQVRGAVAAALHQQAWIGALRHYLQRLADAAVLEGVSLDGT